LLPLLLCASTARAEVLTVKENRADPRSRTIRIRYEVIRSKSPRPAPPIVVLPGGPGSSLLDAFRAKEPGPRRRLAAWQQLAEAADVVVLDQRGFSIDMLKSPVVPAPLDQPTTTATETARWRAYAAAIAKDNPEADLRGYQLTEMVADLDELRAKLGAPKISILGGSFGSQWALAYERLHPDHVARLVLTGVEPLDAAFDRPSALYAVLERIARDADPLFAADLPPGGLLAAVTTIRDRLAKSPIRVTVDGETVVLGLEDFQAALLPENGDAWPKLVVDLYRGRYDAWARAEIASRKRPPMTAAINGLVDAGIGVGADRLTALRTDPAVSYVGDRGFELHVGSRSAWPAADIGDGMRRPQRRDTPALFFNGDWDTSTPVENAVELGRSFPNGRVVVVRRGEHGSISYLTRQSPATFAAVIDFFATGRMDRIPPQLELSAPTFSR
jgi:pimeloyl-ACP methyl ester carboxylesterase